MPRRDWESFFGDSYAYLWVLGETPEWAYEDMKFYEENGGKPEDWTRIRFELRIWEDEEDGDGEEIVKFYGSYDKNKDSGMASYADEFELSLPNSKFNADYQWSEEFYNRLSVHFSAIAKWVGKSIKGEAEKRLLQHFANIPTPQDASYIINWSNLPPQIWLNR